MFSGPEAGNQKSSVTGPSGEDDIIKMVMYTIDLKAACSTKRKGKRGGGGGGGEEGKEREEGKKRGWRKEMGRK